MAVSMGNSRIKYNLKIPELNSEIQVSLKCSQVHIVLIGLRFNVCGHGIFYRELQLFHLGDPRFLASRTGKVFCSVLIDVGPKFNFNSNQLTVFSKQILTIFFSILCQKI